MTTVGEIIQKQKKYKMTFSRSQSGEPIRQDLASWAEDDHERWWWWWNNPKLHGKSIGVTLCWTPGRSRSLIIGGVITPPNPHGNYTPGEELDNDLKPLGTTDTKNTTGNTQHHNVLKSCSARKVPLQKTAHGACNVFFLLLLFILLQITKLTNTAGDQLFHPLCLMMTWL